LGKRFAHSRDIDAYLGGASIIIDVEELSVSEKMNEYVMLGMRLSEGVSFSDFTERFGCDMPSVFPNFEKYAPEFVKIDTNGCRFTEKGLFVSNYILSDALEFGK
jgi:oxygen-independent coproporphyrinogen-3 oxidase